MDKPQLTQLPNYQNYQNAIKVKTPPLSWIPFSTLSILHSTFPWKRKKTFLIFKISFSFSSIASPLQFWPKNSHFCSLFLSVCLIFKKLSFHSFSLSNFLEKVPISLSLSLKIEWWGCWDQRAKCSLHWIWSVWREIKNEQTQKESKNESKEEKP